MLGFGSKRSTLWLSLLTAAALVYAVVAVWDVDPRELWGYTQTAALGLLLLIALAGILSLVVLWWRRWRGDRSPTAWLHENQRDEHQQDEAKPSAERDSAVEGDRRDSDHH